MMDRECSPKFNVTLKPEPEVSGTSGNSDEPEKTTSNIEIHTTESCGTPTPHTHKNANPVATDMNRFDDMGPLGVSGRSFRGLKKSGAGPTARIPVSQSQSVNEIDFTEMGDGTLVELVEHRQNPGRRCFAIWKDGEVRFSDRLEQHGQVFVPTARDSKILECIRLPRGAESYGSAQELVTGLESFIKLCIALDEKYVPVLANFVLSTWFVDRFLVAPYLSVVGLPQSGKTTLLKLLKLVCRRSLLVSDISSASFYWACARFMATILIDETGTTGNNRYRPGRPTVSGSAEVFPIR
jgi:hypothetical protein